MTLTDKAEMLVVFIASVVYMGLLMAIHLIRNVEITIDQLGIDGSIVVAWALGFYGGRWMLRHDKTRKTQGEVRND